MADQLLSRNYIEFISKGLDDVDAATAAFKKKLDDTNTAANGLQKSLNNGTYLKVAQETQIVNQRMAGLNEQARKLDLQAQFGKAGAALHLANEKLGTFNDGVKRIAGPATAGFAILTGSIMGFVRAGLAGTIEGDRLHQRFQMLSREIAGVFLPIINTVTSKLTALVMAFKSLSGEKQNLIMRFALGAAAGLAVAAVFPKIVAGIQFAIMGLKALSAAIAAAGTSAGIASGGLVPLIGTLVTAGVALGAFMFTTKGGADGLGKLQEVGKRMLDAVMPPLTRAMDALGVMITKLATVAVPAVVLAFQAWATQLEIVIALAEKLIAVWKWTPGGIVYRMMMDEGSDDKKGKDNQAHRAPTASGSGFEDFMGTYKRIATASASAGVGDPAVQTAENTKLTAEQIKALNENLIIALGPLGSGGVLKVTLDRLGRALGF